LKDVGLVDTFLKEKSGSSLRENLSKLERFLSQSNITKSTIGDLELSHPGAFLYLTYLLQSKHGAYFGICGSYKVWFNRQGWQYGCRLDKGKGRRIQVYCNGDHVKCERVKELENRVEGCS